MINFDNILFVINKCYTSCFPRQRLPSPVLLVKLAFRRRTKSLPSFSRTDSSDSCLHEEPPHFVRELRSQSVSRSFPFRSAHLIPLVLVVFVFVLQYLFPRLQLGSIQDSRHTPPRPAFCPPPARHPFLDDLICPRQPDESPGTLRNPVPRKMGLVEEARRIAGQFEYTSEDVNKGVKEFIRQMDEGLQKSGTQMSQIPTYVTAVPNGTEKVELQYAIAGEFWAD